MSQKCHEAGTFGGFGKRVPTHRQTNPQDSLFISIDVKPNTELSVKSFICVSSYSTEPGNLRMPAGLPGQADAGAPLGDSSQPRPLSLTSSDPYAFPPGTPQTPGDFLECTFISLGSCVFLSFSYLPNVTAPLSFWPRLNLGQLTFYFFV